MEKNKERKGAIAWMAGNSVAANIIMLLCLIGGVLTAYSIKKEVFPEYASDTVVISVTYSGASPEEIEAGVVLPVEEQISGIDGIDKISSTSLEGTGIITVTILSNQNNYQVYQDIQTEVNKISTFPQGAEKPQVSLSMRKSDVMTIILYGDHDKKVVFEAAEKLKDELLSDSHITQVELGGVDSLEISIEVSKDALRKYGVSIKELATKIGATSIDIPGGEIKTDKGSILLRMKQRADYGSDFAKIPIITNSQGTNVLLGDIAQIKDGFQETDRKALYNGVPAVTLEIYRVGEQTPVGVATAAKKVVDEMRSQLPPGVKLEILKNMSEVYEERVDLLLGNAFLGMMLVFILLGLFLEGRLAFWVTMGIPTSFLGAFLFLPLFGVTINMVSLFAFIIALGIVVDDAIVVGEIIHEKRQEGLKTIDAAIEGVRSVALPVTFSVLTNIVTFAPLLVVPGMMGKIFGQIPIVVIVVFSISLIEAIFILPSHLSHKEATRGKIESFIYENQQKFSRAFVNFINSVYKPFLEKAVEFRFVMLTIAFSILMLTGAYVLSGRIGFVMMPKIESDFASVEIDFPFEAPMSEAYETAEIVAEAARKVGRENGGEKLFKGVFTNVGPGDSSNTAEIRAFLTESHIRPISTAEFVKLWRKEVGEVTGVESITFESDKGGPGHGSSLNIEIAHRTKGVVEQASSDLAQMASEIEMVKDIDDGFAPGKVQYTFKVLPAGESLGLTASEIGTQVRNAFYGCEVTRQVRGRNEVKIMMRLSKNERINEFDLENLILRSPTGAEIPLKDAATIEQGRSFTKLDHVNGRRVSIFTANVVPMEKTSLVRSTFESKLLPDLREKYSGLSWSFGGRQKEIDDSLASLSRYFIISLIVIFGLLAVPLKSYLQPLIIMMSIPFGIIGAVVGHKIMGFSLSINSVMGIIALSGVVINDSLVLIEYANRLVAEGLSTMDAIVAAGTRRFRPILLTTVTTFGGLAPMIFETSKQAQFMIPMAISLGFGLLFSTFVTLVLVPGLYVVVNNLRKI